MMMEKSFRSRCPISSGLDLFGDRWTLLVVRDLLYFGERTFKDFTQAGENISTARLAERLKKLEQLEMLTKERHETNGKVFLYRLTQKGKDLAPVIAELITWSNKYLPDHISEESKRVAKKLESDREGVIATFQK